MQMSSRRPRRATPWRRRQRRSGVGAGNPLPAPRPRKGPAGAEESSAGRLRGLLCANHSLAAKSSSSSIAVSRPTRFARRLAPHFTVPPFGVRRQSSAAQSERRRRSAGSLHAHRGLTNSGLQMRSLICPLRGRRRGRQHVTTDWFLARALNPRCEIAHAAPCQVSPHAAIGSRKLCLRRQGSANRLRRSNNK
jgi:hypothetical protein